MASHHRSSPYPNSTIDDEFAVMDLHKVISKVLDGVVVGRGLGGGLQLVAQRGMALLQDVVQCRCAIDMVAAQTRVVNTSRDVASMG